MRFTKTVGFAGALVLSAVLGGTLIGSALATDEATVSGADTGASAEYCDTFLDALASELGTDRPGLVTAGQSAANAAIDAAVAAGDVTEERAAALRERIDAYDGDGCGLFGRGFARGFHAVATRGMACGFLGGDVFEAAADALGIDSADLIDQARDAGSLEALAETQGVAYDDVKSSVLAAVQADVDAAVAESMDQARADATIERVTTWLDDGGQLDGPGFGGGRGHFGPGHGPGGDRYSSDSDSEDAGT
ncbi:MAG: hypothetical protein ABIO99_03110 [Candidatus Limnocylindria bacterium]